MDGQCLLMQRAQHLAMGPYHFPPASAKVTVIPAGSYFLVQRLLSIHRMHISFFSGNLEFQLDWCPQPDNPGAVPSMEFRPLTTLTLTDSVLNGQGEVSRDQWRQFIIGRVDVPQPCHLRLAVETSSNHHWKEGFA